MPSTGDLPGAAAARNGRPPALSGAVLPTGTTRGTAPDLAPELAEAQARVERLYLEGLALRRDLAALSAAHPVLCLRPEPPGLIRRALLRLLPRLRRARDLRLLRGCGLLEPDWYRARNPDVATAGIDPALHYLTAGAAERRDPGPFFSTGHYLDLYPDIRPPAINPLVHYVLAGHGEGRSIRPGMPHGLPVRAAPGNPAKGAAA